MADSRERLVAYVPVIHAGYINMFEAHEGAEAYVLDEDILSDFPHLRKDIRALSPEQARSLMESLQLFRSVSLLGKSAIQGMIDEEIVMPDDEISHSLAEAYFTESAIVFESIFLRWNRKNSFVDIDVAPDRIVNIEETSDDVIDIIYQEAEKSSDWWRQVGAALVGEDGKVMISDHNHHLPSEYTPWIDGDPRNNAYRGVAVEASTSQHAEASLIAQAAREGSAVEGAGIFVTTFPCPACAKLIGESGIKACYYTDGYAMTDGLEVMKGFGVEIIKVEGAEISRDSRVYKPYPEK